MRSSSQHLSDDQLIDLLYGIGDADGHLEVCPDCDARWAEMQRALGRTRVESAVEISARRLATQRQHILDRVETRGTHRRSWIPAAAAASLLAVALFFSWSSSRPRIAVPAQRVTTPAGAESDAELFTDVYSMERDVEPRAAAPMHALFQQASFESPAPAEESTRQ
jgi:hypothetical protein